MCSTKNSSVFRVQSKEDLEGFSWDRAVRELESRVPTMYTLLKQSNDIKRHHTLEGRHTDLVIHRSLEQLLVYCYGTGVNK